MNPKIKNVLATVITVASLCQAFLPQLQATTHIPAWVGVVLALAIQICNDLTNHHPAPP